MLILLDFPIPLWPISLTWWLSTTVARAVPEFRSVSAQCFLSGSSWGYCFLTAETEKGSADNLDLTGLPPCAKEADSLQMTPPSPDSRKKARGIKRLFGK